MELQKVERTPSVEKVAELPNGERGVAMTNVNGYVIILTCSGLYRLTEDMKFAPIKDEKSI